MKHLLFTIIFGITLICNISSCNLPEMKKLNNESKKEIDSIISELKLEQLEHSYRSKTTNGKTRTVFYVNLWNIDDSTDFKAYNERIISAFEKSGYDFRDINYISIGYYKKYYASGLYVYYDINPKTKQIIKEGTH